MKNWMKVIATIILLLSLIGCNKSKNIDEIVIDEDEINKIFYQNSSDVNGADPFILYDEENELFYLYLTSGDLNAKGFNCYVSSNLSDWNLAEVAFMPEGTWGSGKYWAPEVIEEDGLYYMFYSAQWGDMDYGLYLSVATSKDPTGPFIEYSDEHKTKNEPLVQFENHVNQIPSIYRSNIAGKNGNTGFIKAIDASPFIDPVSGNKYLYFIADIGTEYTNESFVFGMEMEDWVTPKYETLTRLTEYGKYEVGKDEVVFEGGNTNEGCSCMYHDGTYYLTFSTFTYKTSDYQVRQAIADSPLGNFRKIDPDFGGKVIATDPSMINQSAGHGSFFEVGDELMYVYHTFKNNQNIDDGRKAIVDRACFVKNIDGDEVVRVNGPTSTPQPLPEKLSGYKNLIFEASIDATNLATNSKLSCLYDNCIPMQRGAPVNETVFDSGTTNIKIDFNEPKEISSILVYNSFRDRFKYDSIKTITITKQDDEYTYEDILFDETLFQQGNRFAFDQANIIHIKDSDIISINIEFEQDHSICIPEIIVLGR